MRTETQLGMNKSPEEIELNLYEEQVAHAELSMFELEVLVAALNNSLDVSRLLIDRGANTDGIDLS